MDRSVRVFVAAGCGLGFLALFLVFIWPGQWVYVAEPSVRPGESGSRLVRVHRFTDRTEILEPALGWVPVASSRGRPLTARTADAPQPPGKALALRPDEPDAGTRQRSIDPQLPDSKRASETRTAPSRDETPPTGAPLKSREQALPAGSDAQAGAQPAGAQPAEPDPSAEGADDRLLKGRPPSGGRKGVASEAGASAPGRDPEAASSAKQKQAPSGRSSSPSPGPPRRVREVSEDGAYIRLDDGSLWGIAVQDRSRASLWTAQSRVQVRRGVNPIYPYDLTNGAVGQTIKARLLRSPGE